jgi:hypothetical protein
MARTPYESVENLARDQAGVVSRTQLRELGVSRFQVRDAVRARRWRLLGQVVVTHRGPLPTVARWWVAVLHLGPGALLAAWTAAEAAGLAGFTVEAVHVVVARGHRIRALPWMKVHESRRLHPEDLRAGPLLPQVRPARAVLDMASWSTTSRKGLAALAAAVQQRIVTVDQLRAELAVAGRIRRVRLIAKTIDDIEGGSHALSEIDFAALCRRYGLPRPIRQAKRTDASGRTRYLDVWFRRADGRVVHVEIDGAVHLTPLNWWDDMDRQTDLAIREDALVVRIASVSMYVDPLAVARRCARALQVDPPQLRDAA